MSILDVAPLLLYMLNGGIPESMEGKIPSEIFTPAFLSQQPVQIIPTNGTNQEMEKTSGVEIGYDAETEATILSRLRDLGYIE